MRSTSMSTAVINVPVGVGPKAWKRCFLRTARRAEVFGINETLTGAQRDLYKELADDLGLGHYGLRGPNPIFYDQDRWQLVDGRRTPMHGPAGGVLARRWPGYNAGREFTDVTLQDRDTAEQVGAICTHWVPRGDKVPDRWRYRKRRVSRRKILKATRRHLRAGRAVVVLGDFNIHEPINLADGIDPEHGTFRWLRGRGVDKVGVAVPREYGHGSSKVWLFDAPTDHQHGVAASVMWWADQ